jgi:hypothetical protein
LKKSGQGTTRRSQARTASLTASRSVRRL